MFFLARQTSAKVMLVDKPGAVFGSLILAACLLLLVVAPWMGAELWPICLASGGLVFVRNLYAFVICRRKIYKVKNE